MNVALKILRERRPAYQNAVTGLEETIARNEADLREHVERCNAEISAWRSDLSQSYADLADLDTAIAALEPAPSTTISQEGEGLARFGHCADAVQDYLIEVEELQGLAYNVQCGLDPYEDTMDRVFRATSFTVGGDGDAIDGRATLLKIEADLLAYKARMDDGHNLGLTAAEAGVLPESGRSERPASADATEDCEGTDEEWEAAYQADAEISARLAQVMGPNGEPPRIKFSEVPVDATIEPVGGNMFVQIDGIVYFVDHDEAPSTDDGEAGAELVRNNSQQDEGAGERADQQESILSNPELQARVEEARAFVACVNPELDAEYDAMKAREEKPRSIFSPFVRKREDA